MSSPERASFHPDEWVEEKIVQGKIRAREYRADIESAIIRHPLGAVAIGVGAGYLARSLPIARIAATAVRIGLSFAPHLLLGIGAARAWHCLRNESNGLGPIPRLSPGNPASAPGVTVFPGP